jgi:L-serine dehydratase
MRAAAHFTAELESAGIISECTRVRCELYGSLALTGKGHCTDKAILAGLSGKQAETLAAGEMVALEAAIRAERCLWLAGRVRCAFEPESDLVFRSTERLPAHSNGMRFQARRSDESLVAERIYYSVGGGFVTDADGQPIDAVSARAPYPYVSAESLLGAADRRGVRIADVVRAWEEGVCSQEEFEGQLLRIAGVMDACIEAGLHAEGELPGGLGVRRRAPGIHRRLQQVCAFPAPAGTAGEAMDWLSAYAMAVNEENAAMGRVVTAPTNGAAGVIPAVLRYYLRHMTAGATDARKRQDTIEFLLVAGAIGVLYKEGASLSAAEVGCQGEVGVACSMAAGALASVMGASNAQVENAAEIGMEHNLGLTCDPVGGLVQIPCIERNSMGAVKAVNAARLALYSDGRHVVSLDRVIATMRKTGEDMALQYKETSLGGLAIAVAQPEC